MNMVEVGARDNDTNIKKIVEEKLKGIIKNFGFVEKNKRIYKGHPAIYNNAVCDVFSLVQKGGGLARDQLLERKPHWNKNFEVRVVKNLEEHNFCFAVEIVKNLAKHTSEGRPVIWITPVGPMGHYGVIAEMMNKLGQRLGLKPELVFPFAMDEWSDENGDVVTAPEFVHYLNGFDQDMHEQFYGKIADHAKIPEKNLRFAAGEGLKGYIDAMKDLLEQDAGIIFTGGVGMTGHIMFWEPTYGTMLGKEISEKVIYIRGAPLATETIAQNRITSTASAPVPAYANTIGLGLFCMFREYAEKNPDRVNAIFGLDNAEEPLVWQRFIAQCMLATRFADPSFGATYVPTVPGAYIIVENHLKGFNVPAK